MIGFPRCLVVMSVRNGYELLVTHQGNHRFSLPAVPRVYGPDGSWDQMVQNGVHITMTSSREAPR